MALAYVSGAPLLGGMEGRAADWLFVHGRTSPPEPSTRIVHLDIDDSALDTVGRWPWPRKRLADAIRAIDRLGARVIALDLLLIDPQDPQFLADGTRIDHDRELADALAEAEAKTVLAVKVDEEGTLLSRIWTTAAGRRKWQAVLDLLRGDITLDRDTVVRKARLTGERANRVRERIRGIKQIVVRETAARLGREGRLDETHMRRALLPPDKDARLRDFPELHLIRNAVALQHSAQAIERRLPAARENHAYPRIGSVLPPLKAFADKISMVGVSNALQDPDGQLRRIPVRWEHNGRLYFQFGFRAAAAYLGVPPDQLAESPLEFDTDGERFRLASEELILSWPRIPPDKPILGLATHVSLGRIIDLLRGERKLEEARRSKERLSRELVETFLEGDYLPSDLDNPKLRDEVEAAIRDQVEFMLGGEGEDEGPAEKLARAWINLDIEIERGALELERARAELGAALQDKLVFIGWYATGNFGDFFPTAAHERTPGVVAHAVAANSLLTGYVVRLAPAWIAVLVTVALGVGASLVTSFRGPRLSFLVTLLLGAVFLACNILLVFGQWHVISATVTPMLGLLAAWAGSVAMRAVKDLREKAQLRRQFGARISKRLFEFLLDHPDQVSLEGEEKEVTCFFSDLAGFTSISEQLDSRTTVALLNQYMWAMNDELTKLSAYVNKFLGDGIMAVWGAFATESPHAERACRAALRCMQRLEELNDRPEYKDLPKLSMRIGIATGVVTVGDCGAPPDLRDYTVIGDSANLAARLESANKQFGTRILINGRTHELIPNEILTRPLGRITVVGQKTPTNIHEVLAIRGEETPRIRELVEKTERAVQLFQQGDFPQAQGAWRDLPDGEADSKIAQLYLEAIEDQLREPDPDFDGVLRLTSK